MRLKLLSSLCEKSCWCEWVRVDERTVLRFGFSSVTAWLSITKFAKELFFWKKTLVGFCSGRPELFSFACAKWYCVSWEDRSCAWEEALCLDCSVWWEPFSEEFWLLKKRLSD